MLRKFALGLAATVALGAAALSPTSASAWHGGHGWHGGGWGGGWHGGFHRRHHWGPRFFVGGGYGGCYVKRLVPTPYGYRYRRVNICY